MIDSRFGCYAIGICAAVALLAGCGGSQAPIGGIPANGTGHSYSHLKIFHYTGKEQHFTVPGHVEEIAVEADGATGGGGSSTDEGGLGGRVSAVIAVTPGEQLALFVGGQGLFGESRSGKGGFNGGGLSPGSSYGGGGASDVRENGDKLSDRVIVAAGGGGSSGGTSASGGAGGGKVGDPGSGQVRGAGGGDGGTQQGGGAGGQGAYGTGSYYSGQPGAGGKLGRGGDGGKGGKSRHYGGLPGAGGGGGYYGGGGGGGGPGAMDSSNNPYGGGGGGGSSYVEKSATHVTNKRGAALPGNGQVIITWDSR